MLKPAVFLERDGVLNSLVFDEARGGMASPLQPDQLSLERQAASFVSKLNRRGFLVLVVTSQPGIAQGRLDSMRLDRIHNRLRARLASSEGRLDGVFVCPHDADAQAEPGLTIRPELTVDCQCRCPAPGLLLKAAAVHRVDIPRSFMICQDLQDVKAGRSATVETILLTNSKLSQIEAAPELRPNHVAVDLATALSIIDASREAALQL